ncbi:MAG: DUF4886 domain-containing protein, partial [Oligosphaeraceae bacterium]|nr:DUF4886 domain-containing protein [Oligosphaeraceae bacterium]
MRLFRLPLIIALVCTAVGWAQEQKPLRLLTIGNSFSNNAVKYLPQMLESAGIQAVIDRSASLGGHSLAKHLGYAMATEKDPQDPAGRPYSGKTKTLPEILQSHPWDFITIQQVSHQSYDPDSFTPALELLQIIRKYAPQAEVLLHETWAYRKDSKNPVAASGEMYPRLHAAYQKWSATLGLRLLPVGTAFENASKDPRFPIEFTVPADPSALQYPALPPSRNSLHVGYIWRKNKKDPEAAPKLAHDPAHASVYGEYLGAAVWFEAVFGDVNKCTYAPPSIAPDTAAVLRDIAKQTVAECKSKDKP